MSLILGATDYSQRRELKESGIRVVGTLKNATTRTNLWGYPVYYVTVEYATLTREFDVRQVIYQKYVPEGKIKPIETPLIHRRNDPLTVEFVETVDESNIALLSGYWGSIWFALMIFGLGIRISNQSTSPSPGT